MVANKLYPLISLGNIGVYMPTASKAYITYSVVIGVTRLGMPRTTERSATINNFNLIR